ncbi:MAG TPA: biotin--[acetyl-CoA-carboxylase] ligase [Hyphomicrobium sp.]|nr:biotin--[acetyl-CoA-carboxylase] ligase [Hyphomicrobium sp.]
MTAAHPRIIRLSETGSTNRDAMRLALNGEPLPLWVVAERQTEGRGRVGRSWVSPTGNLHASLAFRTDAPPASAGQIALVAGVALHEAIAALTDLAGKGRIRLKWPNDLMIGDAKAGGILVESTLVAGVPGGGLTVVAGFGLNVSSAPELDRPVTSLALETQCPNAEMVLAALMDSCHRWFQLWDEGRAFSAIRKAWQERAGPIGQAITVTAGNETLSGSYQGLNDDGALLANVAGRLETFNFGDVALAASAPGGPKER